MITLPKSLPWPTLMSQRLAQQIESLRQQRRSNRQRTIFQKAVIQAYQRFAAQHPHWANSLFDAHFLTTDAEALLAQVYTQQRWPGAYELAVAALARVRPYRSEMVSAQLDLMIPVAADFLNHLRTTWQTAKQSAPAEEATPSPQKLVTSQPDNELAVALLQIEGPLDRHTYTGLIEAAAYWQRCGHRYLLLDLRRTTEIELSGLFALHTIARLYAGEALPDPACGWDGVHSAAERITPAMARYVKLVAPPPAVVATLRGSAFCSFLEIYEEMETAITALLDPATQ